MITIILVLLLFSSISVACPNEICASPPKDKPVILYPGSMSGTNRLRQERVFQILAERIPSANFHSFLHFDGRYD